MNSLKFLKGKRRKLTETKVKVVNFSFDGSLESDKAGSMGRWGSFQKYPQGEMFLILWR